MDPLNSLKPWHPENLARARRQASVRLDKPAGWAAAGWRRTFGRRTRVIAVTGSFGKTTTTRAVAAVLGQPTGREFVVNAFARLYVQFIGQTGRQAFAVIEIGIGRPGQMPRYGRVVRPDIAVVTGIGLEHELVFENGLDGIRDEKAQLVRHVRAGGVAVLNGDDERTRWMATQTGERVVLFGRCADAEVRLLGVEARPDGTTLTLTVAGREHTLRTRLIGSVCATPLLAAVAVAHAAGLDVGAAVAALEALTPTCRRMQALALPNGVAAILDDYKNVPPTAHAAFDAVAELPPCRRVLVLGNIPMSTPEPKSAVYHAIGEHASRVFDYVVTYQLGDEAFEGYRGGLIAGGFDAARIARAATVQDAAELLRHELRPGDTVLFKGHFFDKASRIVLLLQGVPVRCALTQCMIRGSHWCDRCPYVSKAGG